MFEDESDSDSDYWETHAVTLRPDGIWEKPARKICVLTGAVLAKRNAPGDDPFGRGILKGENWQGSFYLCVLLKSRPSQQMRLVWRPDQEINLINCGTLPITITVLLKPSSV